MVAFYTVVKLSEFAMQVFLILLGKVNLTGTVTSTELSTDAVFQAVESACAAC